MEPMADNYRVTVLLSSPNYVPTTHMEAMAIVWESLPGFRTPFEQDNGRCETGNVRCLLMLESVCVILLYMRKPFRLELVRFCALLTLMLQGAERVSFHGLCQRSSVI